MLIIRAKEGFDSLGYVLRKNPQTSLEKGGFKQSVGTGVYYGYYPIKDGVLNPNEFHLQFIGNREEVGVVEQFPISHLTSPTILKGLVSTLLRSGWKDPIDVDGPIELEFFLFTNRNLNAFGTNVIESKYMAHHIKQEFPTLFQGLNWLLALTYYLSDDLREEDCIKASTNCNNARLGYYPRYLISKGTPHPHLFSTSDIQLDGGPTNQQRRKAIHQVLKDNPAPTLIDMGAGSLYVLKKLRPLYQQVIAIDKSFSDKSKGKAKDMNIQLVEGFIEDYIQIVDCNNTDVIISEVLEHNPKELALDVLERVFNGNPSRVIITLPNKEFNKNFTYKKEEEGDHYRHEEHLWEPTLNDLKEFLPEVYGYEYEVKGIGDRVGDDYITWMITYRRKN